MSRNERRNLYRLLHVQPEAPEAVIKAAYRALMSTLRAHPDLGGEHETAARLNAAYAVLSDPVQRATYDASRRRKLGAGRGPAAAERGAAAADQPDAARGGQSGAASDPLAWLLDRRCPGCGTPFGRASGRDLRCTHCHAPLHPAPGAELAGTELLGRRRGPRFERQQPALVRRAKDALAQAVKLRDLSLTGVSWQGRSALVVGDCVWVRADNFEAQARVLQQRAHADGFIVHAQLLTLQLHRRGGSFVTETA
jgi:curved DNA-binding protein CbpA